MTKYLIRKIHHTTDEVFLDATKAKENETFIVVDAESKEEAEKMAMGEIVLRPVITKNYEPPEFDDESGEKEISRKDIERAMLRKKGQ
ncbi:DUF1381 domain-containing protein [Staphylococcus nepalensis]|uniref:DUF1381 domain-containing protein n=1 Tax=Staphylococcus nepalensis TaxID=214473 RepID=UPI0011C79243|nr:DUF1381 domain-containing protein [Staphylococcus nepalensis]